MEVLIKENLQIITFTGMGYTYGQIRGSMKEIGRAIKCKVKEFLPGAMGGSTRETILMIKNRVKESSHGLMEDSTREDGMMGSNMVMESICHLKEKLNTVNGRTERG